MPRDWDVVRDVLLEVDALDSKARNSFSYTDGEGDDALVAHALMLWKAGFIEAIDAGTMGGDSIMCPQLTWEGHNLLETLRDKPVWTKIKAVAAEKGIELSFDAVKAIGKAVLGGMFGGGGPNV